MNKMKSKLIGIGILFLLLILSSCRSEKKKEISEKSFPVIIERFDSDKLKQSDTTTLTIRENDTLSLHLYGVHYEENIEINMGHAFEINKEDESQILINKIPSKLIAEKQYFYEHQNIIVKKYYYDIKNEIDEEGFFFVANNRIIAFNSTAWNLYNFYNYENSEINKILRKDTTDFFNHWNKN